MSVRHYQGAALCWNTDRKAFYDAACNTIEWNNIGYASDYEYQCFGILPSKFYQNLVDGGEDDCVCKFYSETGDNPWTYEGEWGVCNGACTSPSFDCDGANPIALDGAEKRSMAGVSVSNATSTATTSSAAATGSASANIGSYVAAPLLTSVKGLMVATLLVIGYVMA